MNSRRGFTLGFVAIAAWVVPDDALAFCRTTTQNKCVPADYDASTYDCWEKGREQFQAQLKDICAQHAAPKPDYCAPDCFTTKDAGKPIYWKNQCVGYSLYRGNGGTQKLSGDAVSTVMRAAFSAWEKVNCGKDYASIRGVELAAVECGSVRYNRGGPNQNVIFFRDTRWPYEGQDSTLALTTVTYSPDSGEIFDADIEINASNPATVPTIIDEQSGGSGYDLQAIITHEVGHFYGLAHSNQREATMYAKYDSVRMRTPQEDDIAAICDAYPTDGHGAPLRSVYLSNNKEQTIPADVCDPTPRGGFIETCDVPPDASLGCSLTRGRDPRTKAAFALPLFLFAVSRLRRRFPTVSRAAGCRSCRSGRTKSR